MSSYEKPDFWSLKAQKEGYPARSVYKLQEIDEKFHFFHARSRLPILDLGAAPGSWSLYILRRYPSEPRGALLLAAADLLPLSPSAHFDREDFYFIRGDFSSPELREELFRRGPYGAVISDAAPGTTGSRTVDTLRSQVLAEEALYYAEQCLVPGGNLAFKVFQGGGTAELLKRLGEDFESAKSFKPAACRSSSFETYYIGLGKRNKLG